MKILINVIALLCAAHCIVSEELRLLNLDPPEAQQYIDKQDTSLKYAPKIETNVPAVRFLGNEPHNVVEDIYLANQYHGQDGLGGYLYGYSVPDIAKTERKKADGDLTGAYNYIAGNGQEIKVQYWDDGTGFHQIDNVPKILPKQIDDTPEVKAAKEEHERIWNEQALRNSKPIENPFDSHFNYAQGPLSPQGQTQAQQLVNQYQQQRNQFPNPGQNVHYQGDQYPQYQSLSTQNVNKYQQPGGQISGGSQLGSGQYGGAQSGGGQYGGAQLGSGQLGGAQLGSGQLGGAQSGSGQYGGAQSGSQSSGGQLGGGISSGHLSGSVQSSLSGGSQSAAGPSSLGGPFVGGQSSGAGQSSGVGQFGGSKPSGSAQSGQYGGGSSPFGGSQSSGAGQLSGGGQLGGSKPSGQLGSGQYGGGSSLGGPFGGSQSSAGGQIGGAQGQLGASGQYGGSLSSGGGQLSGSQGQLGASGQYGGGKLSGGQGQLGAFGQYGGGLSSGSGQYSGSYGSSSQYSSQHSGGQQSDGQYQARDEGNWNEEEGEKGPPKGFFYNFDYPVGIIVQKDGGSVQKREGDLKDIYSANKANFEKQVQAGAGSSAGYLVV